MVPGANDRLEFLETDPPHTLRGWPFQALSVGEALRLDRIVLTDVKRVERKRTAPAMSLT
jgi:hypothetical protein